MLFNKRARIADCGKDILSFSSSIFEYFICKFCSSVDLKITLTSVHLLKLPVWAFFLYYRYRLVIELYYFESFSIHIFVSVTTFWFICLGQKWLTGTVRHNNIDFVGFFFIICYYETQLCCHIIERYLSQNYCITVLSNSVAYTPFMYSRVLIWPYYSEGQMRRPHPDA